MFRMFRLSTVLLVAALVFGGLVGNVDAADTLEGEVLDMACFLADGAKGPAHKRCAQTCAEHGMPLGLLAEDGSVYLLYPKHGKEEAFETVKKLAGADARLTGKSVDRSGLKGFEVHSAEPSE